MIDFFLKAATQILMVLLYIAIGFILRRSKMLPETTSKTLSVMETLVFLPALLFNNLSANVKIEKITTYSQTILCGAVFFVFVLLIAFVFTKLFMKGRPKEEYGTSMYMFAFANYGYFDHSSSEFCIAQHSIRETFCSMLVQANLLSS